MIFPEVTADYAPTPCDIVLSFRSNKAELALLRSDRRHGFRLQCYVQVDGVMERVRDRRPQRRMPDECLKCLTRWSASSRTDTRIVSNPIVFGVVSPAPQAEVVLMSAESSNSNTLIKIPWARAFA